jgi:ABC-type glycerol-3-phosphate transport system substrate-binding protein
MTTMPSLTRILTLSLSVLALSACGGGESDDSSSSSSSSITGTWYSSSTKASWTFYSDRTGTLRQKASDGSGACRITDLTYSYSNGKVSYSITRAAMTGSSGYDYDEDISPAKGPYTESISVSGSSVTIGGATYSKGSMACS